MSDPHWTLSAQHLGRLTDAEATIIEDAIEELMQAWGIMPGRYGEYSILGAFRSEYEKARAAWSAKTRRFDDAMQEWRQS